MTLIHFLGPVKNTAMEEACECGRSERAKARSRGLYKRRDIFLLCPSNSDGSKLKSNLLVVL